MKNCSKCDSEITSEAKFCSTCGEAVVESQEETITMEEIIKLQEVLKKDFDPEKKDEDMSSNELANKLLYRALDDALGEGLGEEIKGEYDLLRDKSDSLLKFQDNLQRLVKIGQEIEENLLNQYSYLIYFFDNTSENAYKEAENKLTSKMLAETTPQEEKLEIAQTLLNLTENYGNKILGEVVKNGDITEALIKTFEEKVISMNSNKYLEDFSEILNDLNKWLDQTKELVSSRNLAIKAVREELVADKIVPTYVIENNGDTSVKVKSTDMFSVMERVLRLTNESKEIEERIEKERVPLSESLFGKREDYMVSLKPNESPKENEPVKKYMLVKWGIVAILSIIALSGGVWTAIGVFILGMIVINFLVN